MPDAVDPDDVSTWPEELREALAPFTEGVDPNTYADELGVTVSDAEATALLGGRPLRTYHATRLLPLREDWRGVWPLLSTWGGEAIYMHADAETRARLAAVGVPSVVVLDLPLTGASWLMFPGLATILAARLARLSSPGGADVFYRASVPASAVVEVWQPGAPRVRPIPGPAPGLSALVVPAGSGGRQPFPSPAAGMGRRTRGPRLRPPQTCQRSPAASA